jgi:poly-beta-hydroxyalkanoate depolymerase
MKMLLRPINASSGNQDFGIPIKWEMQAVLNVTAKNLKQAVQTVNRHEYELPEGEYVADSFEIDYDRLENA